MFCSKLKKNFFNLNRKCFRRFTVLGIETSCDDTGCAVVTDDGKVLAESLRSQALIHLRNGGIIPPIARDLHAECIENVVSEALQQSRLQFQDIDAIAATVKPGLSLSLLVGARYGQALAKTHKRPFIGIHHMEAHALSVRMTQKVEFPFLVLLISGGHCLLAIAKDVDQFMLLGESQDDAPGEAFDKIARRMKLTNLPEYREIGGGEAIEKAAQGGNPLAFQFSPVLMRNRDCNFSFSGLKAIAKRHTIEEEEKFNVPADGVVPSYRDIAASFQHAIVRHLCHRVQRGMDFIALKNLIPSNQRCLVVAGGVACNKYIIKMLNFLCESQGYDLKVPPASLCTDNGLMIAWNGVERFRKNLGIVSSEDAHTIDIEPRCPFGVDNRAQVLEAAIKCSWVKLPTDFQSISPM